MGGGLKNWKKRHFILTKQSLSYFKKEGDKKAKGVITLSGQCQVHKFSHSGTYHLELETPDRNWEFKYENEEDLDAWEEAIQKTLDPLQTKSDETAFHGAPSS